MNGDPKGSWQERVDWIDGMLQRYIELAKTQKSWDEHEPELMAIGEAIPYDGEIDKTALKQWRELMKVWDAGWNPDQEEYVAGLEAPWVEVIVKYGLDKSDDA